LGDFWHPRQIGGNPDQKSITEREAIGQNQKQNTGKEVGIVINAGRCSRRRDGGGAPAGEHIIKNYGGETVKICGGHSGGVAAKVPLVLMGALQKDELRHIKGKEKIRQ